MKTKPIVHFSSFANLDIRVGKVTEVEDSLTTKPTYRLTIDFGSPIGTKKSCGAYKNYPRDFLVGKQVICIMNFGPKKMGPETSEVLVLGVPNSHGDTIFLTPQQEVELGVEVF